MRRAYRAQVPDDNNVTLAERFLKKVKYDIDGDAYLAIDDISEMLETNVKELRIIFTNCNFKDDHILYDDFINFLDSGNIPGSVPREKKLKSEKCMRPKRKTSLMTTNDSVYPEVWACLNFISPSPCRALALHKKASSPSSFPKSTKIDTNTWKKHETVIQEKIVKYVTRNKDGSLEELEERERKQDEIMHFECKDTGQFAHHELSRYEKSEMFCDELLSCQKGSEEYVHFKSKDDEYEYFDGGSASRPSSE